MVYNSITLDVLHKLNFKNSELIDKIAGTIAYERSDWTNPLFMERWRHIIRVLAKQLVNTVNYGDDVPFEMLVYHMEYYRDIQIMMLQDSLERYHNAGIIRKLLVCHRVKKLFNTYGIKWI